MAKTTAQQLATARIQMQHLIEINAPIAHRAQHERLINRLKEQLAQGK